MKNNEIAFYFLNNMDIYQCTSEVMKIQFKYLTFFPCT